MSLFTPSENDKEYEKKPRFLQDAIAYIIMGVVGIITIIYVIFFAN